MFRPAVTQVEEPPIQRGKVGWLFYLLPNEGRQLSNYKTFELADFPQTRNLVRFAHIFL